MLTDSWVHCNDAKLQVVRAEDVMKAQAYILFYTRRKVDIPDQHLAVPLNNDMFQADEDITFNFKDSKIPKFEGLKRRLSQAAGGQRELKRRKTTMWWRLKNKHTLLNQATSFIFMLA